MILSLEGRGGPPYRAIADAIRDAIRQHDLRPGDRLPPQRALAWELGVATATVTRAYKLAMEWGLLTARVGSGTRVAYPLDAVVPTLAEPRQRIDMGLLRPASAGNRNLRHAAFTQTLADVGAELETSPLSYVPELGRPDDCHAGAKLLAQSGADVDASQVAVCRGAQEAFLLVLILMTEPGDPVLVESPCYIALKSLLDRLRRRPVPVELDAAGMRADALDQAARRSGAKLVFLTPALQNPTGAVMPAARRAELAAVLADRDLVAVEDDAFSALDPAPLAPLQSRAPDRVFLTYSLSKLAAPSLRLSYLAIPEPFVEGIETVKHATAVAGPLTDAATAARWVKSGTVSALARAQRTEIRRRRALLAPILPLNGPDWSPFLWIAAPNAGTAARLDAAGLRVLPSAAFDVPGMAGPSRIRLSLTTPSGRSAYAKAVEILTTVWPNCSTMAAIDPV